MKLKLAVSGIPQLFMLNCSRGLEFQSAVLLELDCLLVVFC